MGMSLIYGILFLGMFFLIGITVLYFSIKKRTIIGIISSLVLIAPIVLFCLTNTIDELSISENDVNKDLAHLHIKLKDKFKILNNSVKGMPERIQETEIEISEMDKINIIQLIKNTPNFKSFNDESLTDTAMYQLNPNNEIINFKYPEFYSREIFKQIDDYPTRIQVTIEGSSNILKYRRIED
ncbi:hypothetical protein [Pedobacter xixiisoli]|uniref:Uncharacterized protein n=1 Tax=Pedobacter xixiisoli TaxID=1476464 RepID=A0A285ZPU2_9SPHI|nr:hypothetical protein [Pedobacter xixiisoli]SOD11648.1 hypothetical protein SAMN06297358_0262 [Pedobacter xixiisoli]